MSENTIVIQYYKSKFGELLIGEYKRKICICDWRFRKMRESIDRRIQTGLNAKYKEGESTIIDETIDQLSMYFSNNLKEFNIPLHLVGTEFQKEVWNSLLQIPYGITETYNNLSIKMNNKQAIRAVASANGANAISIMVPCHRIIGSDGKLVGYAGGLETKRRLLKLEGSYESGQLSIF